MHIIILNKGFYFSGKIGELRFVLARLASGGLSLAGFLRRNVQ
ncbi:MAG: hypothetical protein P4N41_25460 [Negativicutes bacterium]|nr:hypothetical protein [Negativicutes bacterium]